ncbi:MAG TPA: SDR family NAD(P)-dependent oxidoreductase [Acidimicrobiales bacterium]|jgi:decaprenylphospho-beta-D-erythro-pentofuranosid-2-ulose 2-reductase|nr:SDR family NAD(P)-dependent oxidoreductase [Acidimicrobiales bacterium]
MKDALGSVQTVLVLGGSSEIGLAIARALAAPRQAHVILASRKPDETVSVGGRTTHVPFDADDVGSHASFVADVFGGGHGDIDVVVVAFGVLDGDPADVARTNFLGAVSVTSLVADRLREQGHGEIVVLSSVAGERVRKSNYVYGATKAGLDGFAQGLGDALAGSGVHVLVVRPGFVKTKMTAGMEAAPLSTTADAVADAVVRGLARGADTVWVPGALRFVMAALRHLPRAVFRRLPF